MIREILHDLWIGILPAPRPSPARELASIGPRRDKLAYRTKANELRAQMGLQPLPTRSDRILQRRGRA